MKTPLSGTAQYNSVRARDSISMKVTIDESHDLREMLKKNTLAIRKFLQPGARSSVDRASGFEPGGRRFESVRARHSKRKRT
jgi:hypothetical protein